MFGENRGEKSCCWWKMGWYLTQKRFGVSESVRSVVLSPNIAEIWCIRQICPCCQSEGRSYVDARLGVMVRLSNRSVVCVTASYLKALHKQGECIVADVRTVSIVIPPTLLWAVLHLLEQKDTFTSWNLVNSDNFHCRNAHTEMPAQAEQARFHKNAVYLHLRFFLQVEGRPSKLTWVWLKRQHISVLQQVCTASRFHGSFCIVTLLNLNWIFQAKCPDNCWIPPEDQHFQPQWRELQFAVSHELDGFVQRIHVDVHLKSVC